MPAKNVTLQTKYSQTPGAIPGAGSMTVGEFAINVVDKTGFVGDANGDPVVLFGEPGGGEVTVHNSLDGRTVADCHPLTSIYDADSQEDPKKNLADILQEKPNAAPSDGDYYCQLNGAWVSFDPTPPGAEWGNIGGSLAAQVDLYANDTYALQKMARKASNDTISGSWTITGANGGGYGLKFRSYGYVIEDTSNRIYLIGAYGYHSSTSTLSGVYSNSGGSDGMITYSGRVYARRSSVNYQLAEVGLLAAAFAELANNPPSAAVSAMAANNPQAAVAAVFQAIADKLNATPDITSLVHDDPPTVAGLN